MSEGGNEDHAKGLEHGKPRLPMPDSLRYGIGAVVTGLAYMLAVFLFGIHGLMLAVPACIFVLIGFIAALSGVARKRNRTPLYVRCYGIAIVVLAGEIAFLLPGFGTIRLLNWHCRTRVATTGGQEELQQWAVDLLARPRDSIDREVPANVTVAQWDVPEKFWSDQVQRLKPKRVFIDHLFQNGREGITLTYGGGFLGHWWIVVGPPGAILDPKLTENQPDIPCFRWRDGVYCYFLD